MLKKYYLSKSEMELILIALGELVIYEKKKSQEDKKIIQSCKDLINKLEGINNEETKEKEKK